MTMLNLKESHCHPTPHPTIRVALVLAISFLVGCTPTPPPMEAIKQCTEAGGSSYFFSNGAHSTFTCKMPADQPNKEGKF